MLSLSQTRKHLFELFNLMDKTGEVFEVVYKGTVYDLSVRRTNKVSNLKRPKQNMVQQFVPIDAAECHKCGSLKFQGVCMNTKCV